MCLLCDLISSEENKAEEDAFETDLIAGRLQEEVVRVSSVLKGVTESESTLFAPQTGTFLHHSSRRTVVL